ncbi:MAG TPA: nucleotidyltransferase family protein [Acidimicrobiales bacterium]|nr:nucleotidyltransferase family protein [Acidimicrobiales bacterium]
MTAGPLLKHSALLVLGRALAGEALELDEPTWRALSEVVVEHHLAAALWISLGPNDPPPSVREVLCAEYHRNLGSTILVREQLREVVRALNSAGITPAPLKGALHLLEGTFSHPAERVVADIDLLVAPPDFTTAKAALEADGYGALRPRGFGQPHETQMVLDRRGAMIELHHELGEPGLNEVLSTSEYLARSATVDLDGLRYRSPSASHVVLHNVLHAQVSDHNYAVFGLPLRQLHTLTAFVRRRGEEIDWDEVTQVMDAHHKLPVLAGYLDLAGTIFGLSEPIELPSSPWRRNVCILNAAFGGRVGDLVRNIDNAFGSDYLRARYGEEPRPRLWAKHAWTLWNERGTSTIAEAFSPTHWR